MEESNFNRLPAEIRDAIYTLILGCHDIHVRTAKKVSFSVCTEPVSHRQIISALQSRPLHDLQFPEELDHFHCATHHEDLQPAPTLLNLALLWTCRQVHAGAALIPFKANTFVLSQLEQLSALSRVLSQRQSQAVTSICLVTSYFSRWSFYDAQRSLSFGGVQRLIAVLGIPHRTRPEDIKALLTRAGEMFGGHSVLAAHILIRFRKHKCSKEELQKLHDQYAEWAHETEQALLRPIDSGES